MDNSTAIILFLVICVFSYFVGSLPFGLWVGIIVKGVDIRTLGSQNIGATNVIRVLGIGPGVVVFLLDTLKGAVGVILAKNLLPILPVWYYIIIAFLAIIGHTYSIFLGFKGGKGVATTLGALLSLNPAMALLGFAIWIIVVISTKYVSLASLIGSATLPISPFFILKSPDKWWLFGVGLCVFILISIKHRANISRLKAGTESKIWGSNKSNFKEEKLRETDMQKHDDTSEIVEDE